MSGSFYFDHKISPFLIDAINEARNQLIFVSPYIELWGHLRQTLNAASSRGVRSTLYVREDQASKLDQKDLTVIFDKIHLVENLHAKIFLFDDRILVSSMNLYDFSQRASRDIAIEIMDEQQKTEIRRYIGQQLMPASKPYHEARSPETGRSKAKPTSTTTKKTGASKSGKLKETPSGILHNLGQMLETAILSMTSDQPGVCIRCGDDIDFNPEKPYCYKCFKSWQRYSNPDYEEDFCHSCGRDEFTTMAKPVCYSCYKSLTA